GGIVAMGLPFVPLAWVVAVLGASVLEWRLGGASVGKRLMSLRTVDGYGLAPTFAAVLGRTVLKAAGPALVWIESALLPARAAQPIMVLTLLAWLASLAIALGRKRLSLHDRLTRTRVVFGPSSVLTNVPPAARQGSTPRLTNP